MGLNAIVRVLFVNYVVDKICSESLQIMFQRIHQNKVRLSPLACSQIAGIAAGYPSQGEEIFRVPLACEDDDGARGLRAKAGYREGRVKGSVGLGNLCLCRGSSDSFP